MIILCPLPSLYTVLLPLPFPPFLSPTLLSLHFVISSLPTPPHPSFRMYGALTGLSKQMVAQRHGPETLKKWRRGYATRPPPISSFSASYPGTAPCYVTLSYTFTAAAPNSVGRDNLTSSRALVCVYLSVFLCLSVCHFLLTCNFLYIHQLVSFLTSLSLDLSCFVLPGNDDRYVSNVQDVRYSLFESLIRSLGSRRLELHRKFPKAESLKVGCYFSSNFFSFSFFFSYFYHFSIFFFYFLSFFIHPPFLFAMPSCFNLHCSSAPFPFITIYFKQLNL